MKALLLRYSKPIDFSYRSEYPSFGLHREITKFLSMSVALYPGIEQWYYQKFVPGLSHGNRCILLYCLGDELAGIALLKKEINEKKICSVRVRNKYRNNGIGRVLFDKCIETLATEKPIITVSSEKLHHFASIFKYYNFKVEEVVKDCYRRNSTEYVFNGILESEYCNNISSETCDFQERLNACDKFPYVHYEKEEMLV
jgi:hypothetical protein